MKPPSRRFKPTSKIEKLVPALLILLLLALIATLAVIGLSLAGVTPQ